MKWLGCNTHNTVNHLASLAKWLSFHLRTKWLWVRVQLQSLEMVRVGKIAERLKKGIAGIRVWLVPD